MTDFIAIIIHIFPERVGDNCWLSVHWAAAVVHDPKKQSVKPASMGLVNDNGNGNENEKTGYR